MKVYAEAQIMYFVRYFGVDGLIVSYLATQRELFVVYFIFIYNTLVL